MMPLPWTESKSESTIIKASKSFNQRALSRPSSTQNSSHPLRSPAPFDIPRGLAATTQRLEPPTCTRRGQDIYPTQLELEILALHVFENATSLPTSPHFFEHPVPACFDIARLLVLSFGFSSTESPMCIHGCVKLPRLPTLTSRTICLGMLPLQQSPPGLLHFEQGIASLIIQSYW